MLPASLDGAGPAPVVPPSAVVHAIPLLWQTAPGEQTSPGDHGVQFNVKIADLLRRRMRHVDAAFCAAMLILLVPLRWRFADFIVEVAAKRVVSEPLARFAQAHVVFPHSHGRIFETRCDYTIRIAEIVKAR